MAKGKKSSGSSIMWSGLGLIILLLGAAGALYYLNRDTIRKDERLKVVRDIVEKVESTLGQGKETFQDTFTKGQETLRETLDFGKETLTDTFEKGKEVAGQLTQQRQDDQDSGGGGSVGGLFGFGRSHVVEPGENLWSIAKQGDLVDSPWEWRTIMVQNSDRIDYAFISDESPAWKVVMAEGQELTTSDDPPFPVVDLQTNRYAVQLATLPESGYNRAVFLVRVLIRDGYFGYVTRADTANGPVYRIRSGFYASEDAAISMGEAIQDRYEDKTWFKGKLWTMAPPAGERAGNNIDFGVQRVHPWVIEVTTQNTHGKARKDLRSLSNLGLFAYISQGKGFGGFSYRTRLGYFSSEKAAQQLIDSRSGAMWEDAKPIEIKVYEEAFPGQMIRLREN